MNKYAYYFFSFCTMISLCIVRNPLEELPGDLALSVRIGVFLFDILLYFIASAFWPVFWTVGIMRKILLD